MGYYTNYTGELTISPPITSGERDRLAALVGIELPNSKDVFHPPQPPTARDLELLGGLPNDSLWNWHLEPDTLFAPDGELKGYDTTDGLKFAFEWLKENGHTLDGNIYWEGESNDDSGTIYVNPVHGVEAVADIRDNPGPSWNRVVAP